MTSIQQDVIDEIIPKAAARIGWNKDRFYVELQTLSRRVEDARLCIFRRESPAFFQQRREELASLAVTAYISSDVLGPVPQSHGLEILRVIQEAEELSEIFRLLYESATTNLQKKAL